MAGVRNLSLLRSGDRADYQAISCSGRVARSPGRSVAGYDLSRRPGRHDMEPEIVGGYREGDIETLRLRCRSA